MCSMPLLSRPWDLSVELARACWIRARAGDEEARMLLALDLACGLEYAAEDFLKNHPEARLDHLIGYGHLGIARAVDRRCEEKRSIYHYVPYFIRRTMAACHAEFLGRASVPPMIPGEVRRIARAHAKLKAALGRRPRPWELAAELGWVSPDLPSLPAAEGRALLKVVGPTELAGPVGPLLDVLACEGCEAVVDPEAWRDALDRLPSRLREVLELRLGLKGEGPMTLDAAGRRLKLCRERVRQIQEHAFLRLNRLARSLSLVDVVPRAGSGA